MVVCKCTCDAWILHISLKSFKVYRGVTVTANYSKRGGADNLIPNVDVDRRWKQPSPIASRELSVVDVASSYRPPKPLLGGCFNNVWGVLSSSILLRMALWMQSSLAKTRDLFKLKGVSLGLTTNASTVQKCPPLTANINGSSNRQFLRLTPILRKLASKPVLVAINLSLPDIQKEAIQWICHQLWVYYCFGCCFDRWFYLSAT